MISKEKSSVPFAKESNPFSSNLCLEKQYKKLFGKTQNTGEENGKAFFDFEG